MEFNLAADLTAIEDAISAERAKPAPKVRHWYGTSTTLYSHYPVHAVPPSAIRVEWGVVPGRQALLDVLRSHVQIASPSHLAEDFTYLQTLPAQQQQQRLREMDAAGKTILAIATARRLYGYDLGQAKAFVENLREG